MESLTRELLREILLRVPAIYLAASARHVCRSWRALIDDDPSFARDQLSFATAGHLVRRFNSSTSKSVFTYVSSEGKDIRLATFEPTGHLSRDHPVSEYSSDGLLLSTSGEEDLPAYLCNPLLGDSTSLPRDVSAPVIARFRHGGKKVPCVSMFAFDASIQQYKIFRMRYHGKYFDESNLNLVCEVCTVGGQQPPTGWKTVGAVGRDLRCSGILIDGRFHWTFNLRETVGEYKDERYRGIIVSLDVVTEIFAEFQGPPGVCISGIMSTGGHLSLCAINDDMMGHVDIWVMKEYGKAESWTKEPTPCLMSSISNSLWSEDLCCDESNDIYYFSSGPMMHEFVGIWRTDNIWHRSIIKYTPSLISLRPRSEKTAKNVVVPKRKRHKMK